MPVLEAPELDDVDCALPSPDRSDDRGWASKPPAIAPRLPSIMICPFDNNDR